ncbi:MAG: ABC transporter permease [Marinovum algicola]|jgi:ABC-2 type transport system permease protein|uniref:Transport permease protein n=1 Tax=Marinovum algicola TaxID=42444 RepID=A0A975WAX3_9RHOB|nr:MULTISPECIES: ABC transporter permease [Marinovum]AKO95581.1 ABC-type polysaccharide/polyol phosphate export system, permease component [Marinovum algicola DG 898]MDD9741480.1 ABC transporter permease [Marinovum sp. SP66]MDD9743825.1 ABC transporter permease [Marinovum sp. PR37]SEJ66039.1 ABC-2 type transport system permease protein [Marinovum algicola]SLN53643.1 Inner membrane transport permease YadH [Marinovum algicola]
MNLRAVGAIYKVEMARFFRTLAQSFISPVISTSLYFVVFGTAIGSRIDQVEGISYGAFIVPGLIMLTVMTQGISNASFGIYFPKFIGTFYELLSAPINFLEIVVGFAGAAATKALFIGLVILATSAFFVDLTILHPMAMLAFLVLTCISFSLFGFIIGIWARNFEQLQLIPLLVVTPLVFLGGSFYSISMLPPFWQGVSFFNPVVYLISGFRWAFFGTSDVPIGLSLLAIAGFTTLCLAIVWWIFRTGWRIRT